MKQHGRIVDKPRRRLTIRLTESEHAIVEGAARASGLPMSGILREGGLDFAISIIGDQAAWTPQLIKMRQEIEG